MEIERQIPEAKEATVQGAHQSRDENKTVEGLSVCLSVSVCLCVCEKGCEYGGGLVRWTGAGKEQ